MKIAIISDTHAGARNSSNIFIDYQKDFYSKIFFPYLERHSITQILHLGDYYDHRKFVNFKVLDSNNRYFLDVLKRRGIKMDIIPGNHDCYYRNTNDLCSLDILMKAYDDVVNIYHKPEVIEYDGYKVALVPWINTENYGHIISFLKKVEVDCVAGHFELAGFEMYRGAVAQHGQFDKKLLDRFPLVISGHYHTKGGFYLGSQMEFTWSDADDPKYFHILDTETREIEAVRNPLTLFQKVVYDDSNFDYNNFDYSIFDKQYVKVIVAKKLDPRQFETFVDNIQQRQIYDLKIVESFENFNEDLDEKEFEFESTPDLIDQYVESTDTLLDKDILRGELRSLYHEALEREYIE